MQNSTYMDIGIWARIHAEAWSDEKFRELLESDPTAGVKDFCGRHGISLDGVRLINVGQRPTDLTDEQLTAIKEGRERCHIIAPNSC